MFTLDDARELDDDLGDLGGLDAGDPVNRSQLRT